MSIYQQYRVSQKAVEEADVAVYLTGSLLKVVVGDFLTHTSLAREVYTYTVTDGSLLDGRIADEEAFAKTLYTFFRERNLVNSPVRLVVDSADFISRVLKIPMVNPARTKEYIRRFFSAGERLSDPGYAYLVLDTDEEKKERRVLVSATSRETVAQLERVFGEIGMRLVSVESALLASVRILSALPEIQHKTCMVQVTDGRETTGMMFVDGVYRASMRSHLWEPFASIGFGVEFARINAQILQNMQMEYPDAELEEIYLCGLRDDNLTVVTEAIRHMGEMRLLKAPDGEQFVYADHQTENSPSRFSEFFVPISVLRYKDEACDFLRLCREANRKKLSARTRAAIAGGCALVILLAGALGLRGYQLNRLNTEYVALEKEVLLLEQDFWMYQETLAKFENYRIRLDAMKQLDKILESYPYPNSALNAIICGCSSFTDEEGNVIQVADVRINSYRAETGELSFSVRAPKAAMENYNRFVVELRKLGVFREVHYGGYERIPNTEDEYELHVTCLLSGEAGKP